MSSKSIFKPTGVFKNKLIDVNPSGRLGEQEELANFILYLASDYSYFLNGQIINFDGGEGLFRSGQFNQLKFRVKSYNALKVAFSTFPDADPVF